MTDHVKVKGRMCIPFITFKSEVEAYNELGVHENRGIYGAVRKNGSNYVVYLPENI